MGAFVTGGGSSSGAGSPGFYTETFQWGASASKTFTHNLGTQNVAVSILEHGSSTTNSVDDSHQDLGGQAFVRPTALNTVTVSWQNQPGATDQFTITVIG
jgi:hypothetical protein